MSSLDSVSSAVSTSLGLCRTAVYPWLRKFKDQGWQGLVEQIAQGPEPKLNEKQRQQVRRWVLGKDPRQYGFDFALWTRRIVQALLEEKLGIELGNDINAAAVFGDYKMEGDPQYTLYYVAEADAALYLAKRAGGDRVVAAARPKVPAR